jgi:hypothetical protein
MPISQSVNVTGRLIVLSTREGNEKEQSILFGTIYFCSVYCCARDY